MNSIAIAATLYCAFMAPLGTPKVDVEARYWHEYPPGTRYVFKEALTTPNSTSLRVESEGQPYYVLVSIDGVAIGQCSNGDAIYIDGFESGDMEYWE